MTIETRILLESESTQSTDSTYSYSDKKKGAGYHKNNDGVHTVHYQTDSFIGSIKMQGSLAVEPGDGDWIDIDDTEVGLGEDSTLFVDESKTLTFTGKFVWVRAAYNIQNGTIVQILLNS